MLQKIIEWLLKNIKINKDIVTDAIKTMDKDGDGFFSLGELITEIRRIVRK